jgi:hypothetical protein
MYRIAFEDGWIRGRDEALCGKLYQGHGILTPDNGCKPRPGYESLPRFSKD